MSNISYNFSTLVHGFFDTGGGHTSSSAVLEDLDNANDSFILGDVQNPTILMGYSAENNVMATMDNGVGTDDIRKAYGCGTISKKPAGCSGKFMQGGLAASLSLIPAAIMWFSFNPTHPIPLKLAKWESDKIKKIVNSESNQKEANEKFQDHIKIQADRELTELHPRYAEEIKSYLNNNPEFMQALENQAQGKFLKITTGGRENKKYDKLHQDRAKIINEILFWQYNGPLRRGLVIRDVNLDTHAVTELNATEAKKMHLLGRDTIVEPEGENILETRDFGHIDANRCHCLEVVQYIKKDSGATRIFLYYHNFNVVMEYNIAEQTLTNVDEDSLSAWIQRHEHLYRKSSVRVYISCLSKQERDEQKQFRGLGADECRKMHIFLNLKNGVRGLSRIEYPTDWPNAALRNFKEIGVAICIDSGNDDIISLSAMKSNIKWENVNIKITNLLKISLLEIIGQYNYKIWTTENAETNILGLRAKFLGLFGINEDEDDDEDDGEPEPEPVPVVPIVVAAPVVQVPQHRRAVPLRSIQVLERIGQMTEDEKQEKRSVMISVISKNLNKLNTDDGYDLLEQMLQYIPGNPQIKEGCKL